MSSVESHSPAPRNSKRFGLGALREFLAMESAGGILLMSCAAIAIVLMNSPLAASFAALWEVKLTVGIEGAAMTKSLAHWINDGLMVLFFLLVGLELKRESLEGTLSNRSQILLPGAAALGGMIVPALIYWGFNAGNPVTIPGWAIPCATDIAFSLGVLSLFGRGVPLALKVFLTALAIFDDLGAILIIAIFYTANLSVGSLGAAALVWGALILLNRLGVKKLLPYLALGVLLWFFVFKSGVHATIAGVLLAMTIPLNSRDGSGARPLKQLEHLLHPLVAFIVLPVFALANAGVSLAGVTAETLLAPVTLGIALGLFCGKQIGVWGISKLLVVLKLAKMPEGASKLQFYGVCTLAGIGFTMSLFIGNLAFTDPLVMNEVKLGVIMGSVVSAVVGGAMLRIAARRAGFVS